MVNLSTVSKGKEFEDKVAELYRLMGYEVRQNVGISGHQIDIVLTHALPGGIKIRTAVECKYTEKGNLRKYDIMDNINALNDLRTNGEFQNLIIVTTNGFAKDVWYTAKRCRIELLTFLELQHYIVDFDHYIDRIIKDFEGDDISKYYIDLAAQDDEAIPKEIFDPIDGYVAEWINDETKNHLSILGEYGTGKTTFCRKLAHDLAVQYSKDPLNNRIPILIDLKDYSKVMSVRQLITDLLINEYWLKGINFPLFEKMNEEGLFLLIFDGFDEMAQKVILDVAYSNFSKIAELTKPEKSKVILTCRTEFFRTHEQEKEILLDIDEHENFGIIYLREFTDEQIKEFLQKRVPLLERQKEKLGWRYYYQKIQKIFDLKDLAKRPVLLELIVKYLPHLVKKGERINASTLYDTAIHEELKRKLRVGKTIIRRDDRIKLMKLLATWMYRNDKMSIYYEDIPELLNLRRHFDLKTRIDIEYHLNDFLTCSFLNRDTEGNYRFSHRSFVYFLVSLNIAEDISSGRSIDPEIRISDEIKPFISEFLPDVWIEHFLTKRISKFKARIDLEELDDKAILNKMAAIVAHQVGDPIGRLKTYIKNLHDSIPAETKDNVKEDYSEAISELQSMSRWREDILDLSRPIVLHKKRFNVSMALQKLSREIEIDYPEIEVKLDIDTNEFIFADEDRIIQALRNLITNACESMDNKGLLILGLSKNKSFRISVKDTGIGIKEEDYGKIFRDFYTTKSNGTGLGLTIVKRIIIAHKGEIDLESEYGKRTVFTLIIPQNDSWRS